MIIREATFVNIHTGRDSVDVDPVDLVMSGDYAKAEDPKIGDVLTALVNLGEEDYEIVWTDTRLPVQTHCAVCGGLARLDEMVDSDRGPVDSACYDADPSL